MCVRSAVHSEAVPLESGDTITDQLIVLSDAEKTDHITVAGHRTLDIFLGLCRRGFRNASCCTSASGPQSAHDRADSLWIVEPENAAELRNLIARCGRDLRNGGTLLVSMERQSVDDVATVIGSVLLKCGFTPLRRLNSARHVLLLCQKPTAATVRIAA